MAVLTVIRFLMVGLVLVCFFPWTGHAQEMGVKGLLYGSPESFAEFHGFVNLEYFDFQKDGAGTDEGGPGASSFDQSNFYFNAIAKVRENVTVFGEVEYEHGGGEVKVDRAFIDWILLDQYLAFRLGKFYAPFGLEIREYQAPVRKLISRPHFTEDLLYGEWTDIGLNAYGRIGGNSLYATYDIALANGPKGLRPDVDLQTNDNNSSRTVIGRLGLDYNGPVQASVGGSYAGGAYDSSNNSRFRLSGGDVKITIGGLDIRGEYVSRHGDDQTIVTTDVIPDCSAVITCTVTAAQSSSTTVAEGRGFYGQVSYRIMFRKDGLYYLEPVYRHDVFDQSGPDNMETTDSIGINYAPYPHLVMRGEYQLNKTATPSGVPDPKDNGFLLEAVVDF